MDKHSEQVGYVEFSYVRPDATQVFLVASFNGWNPWANRMHRDSHGRWSCHVRLPAGAYQFHYLAELGADGTSHREGKVPSQWSCSDLEFVVVTPRGGSLEIQPPLSSTLGGTECLDEPQSQMPESLLPLSRLERALIQCFRQLPDHESRSAFLDVLQESVYC